MMSVMNIVSRLKIGLILATAIAMSISSLACVQASDKSKSQSKVVITDIVAWNHPVKAVFAEHKIPLYKVELLKNKTYPIFFVSLPYDPQSSETSDYYNQLYAELLETNGWWSFALNDNRDNILIKVNWDKTKKEMSLDYVPLENSSSEKNNEQ